MEIILIIIEKNEENCHDIFDPEVEEGEIEILLLLKLRRKKTLKVKMKHVFR